MSEHGTNFVWKIASKHAPGWSQVPFARADVKQMSGGISNKLFLLATDMVIDGPQKILVRVFGRDTHLIINRDRETEVFLHLSREGLSPKLYYTYSSGRIEQFIQSHNVHGNESIPEIASKIAQKIAIFHQTKPPGDSNKPIIFERISSWLSVLRSLSWTTSELERLAELDVESVEKDLKYFQTLVEKHSQSPVVFSHNDLLGANILQPDHDSELVLIDFEYAEYNYRGFDLANHFNEYAGFECEYDKYPNKEQQYHFFRSYLEAIGQEPTEEALENMFREVNPFALISHIFWGVWAIVMAKISDVDFDYLTYAGLRLAEYRRRRDELIAYWQ